MESFFEQYLRSAEWIAYTAIFIGMFIEGDGILFVAIYLAHQGHLRMSILMPVVVIGTLLNDIVWYRFGVFIEEKLPFLQKKLDKIAAPIDRMLERRPFRMILIAKFAYGINRATLTRVGAVKMPFKRFLKIDWPCALFWVLVITLLGIASAKSFELARAYLKYAELGILAGLIILFIAMNLVRKYGLKLFKGGSTVDDK